MRRKMMVQAVVDQRGFLGLMVCVVFFACGIIAGTFSARNLDAANTHALQERMMGYMEQIRAETFVSPGFWSVLWTTGRDHLLVLFLGFSLLGVFCLPILSAVRGFYLSFSIATFIRAFGAGGVSVAFSLFGVGALFTVPAFFILVTYAFRASAEMGSAILSQGKLQAGKLYGSAYFIKVALCFLGILVAVLVELYVTPALVSWTSSFL